MKTNQNIFKAYDIRGIYKKDLDEDTAYNIGRAVVSYSGAKKVVVGKDIRKSSNSLEQALINGITDQGADVIKIGLSTTPLLYFASGQLDVDLGIIITASHNPAEYNGFKICRKKAVPIGEGTGMEKIKKLALNKNFSNPDNKGIISENNNINKIYIDYIANFFDKTGNKKKIVIDFANAMGIMDKPIFEKLKDFIQPIYLYDNYDGLFPNHEANPLKIETLKKLQEKVISVNADFGISYDGDADRVGFVDEKGNIVPMDFITALIAKEILKEKQNSLILIDLRSSNAVREAIENAGGKVKLCRVGHSLIKKQMREQNAIFAGELSGHYYFQENNNAEMATLAVLKILNILNKSGKKMSELSNELKIYSHSGEINSTVKDIEIIFNKLEKKYKTGKIIKLDGIRIDFENWWFNVRASNTEPVIRLNLEAKTQKLMEEKKDEILKIIRG